MRTVAAVPHDYRRAETFNYRGRPPGDRTRDTLIKPQAEVSRFTESERQIVGARS
jgi:hypothetical protein